MKVKFIILGISTLITLIIVVSSFLMITALKEKEDPLILKEENGIIVLKKGEDTVTIYDGIVIDVLPRPDREALKNGIIINNQEQLQSIIEDYDG
ncbi:MAG: hypothetical protein E7568_05815 [Ruminococcaceae bacterium]|nr:hypothetical protein [Oscillospiraceae bacterium]